MRASTASAAAPRVSAPRVGKPGSPDRRLTPRPLMAHLASTTVLWQSCRSALPVLRNASPRSNAAGKALRELAAEIDAFGSDKVAEALDQEIVHRVEAYIAGLEAYRRHPFRRGSRRLPVLWREGTTRLLDYGRNGAGPAVLVVPSLINRYYVLDLLPEHSFLSHLATQGLRPLVIDWGAPGRKERSFGLDDYIAGRLEAAFAAAARIAGTPIGVLGYCMGGLLALALALRRRSEIACLALLATPWDFHAGHRQQAAYLSRVANDRANNAGGSGPVPVDVLQSFFFALDPFTAQRKFTRFATLDPEGEEARSFVALEDWLNDGVPLVSAVARTCARGWYGDNEPGRGLWRVAGRKVDPKLLQRPALVVLPGRDRIVPPSSAEPLAPELGAAVLRPPLGHIGMMSAARAPAMLWTPITDWLCAQLGDR
jgi:polyhydroxyalkanoate synthase